MTAVRLHSLTSPSAGHSAGPLGTQKPPSAVLEPAPRAQAPAAMPTSLQVLLAQDSEAIFETPLEPAEDDLARARAYLQDCTAQGDEQFASRFVLAEFLAGTPNPQTAYAAMVEEGFPPETALLAVETHPESDADNLAATIRLALRDNLNPWVVFSKAEGSPSVRGALYNAISSASEIPGTVACAIWQVELAAKLENPSLRHLGFRKALAAVAGRREAEASGYLAFLLASYPEGTPEIADALSRRPEPGSFAVAYQAWQQATEAFPLAHLLKGRTAAPEGLTKLMAQGPEDLAALVRAIGELESQPSWTKAHGFVAAVCDRFEAFLQEGGRQPDPAGPVERWLAGVPTPRTQAYFDLITSRPVPGPAVGNPGAPIQPSLATILARRKDAAVLGWVKEGLAGHAPMTWNPTLLRALAGHPDRDATLAVIEDAFRRGLAEPPDPFKATETDGSLLACSLSALAAWPGSPKASELLFEAIRNTERVPEKMIHTLLWEVFETHPWPAVVAQNMALEALNRRKSPLILNQVGVVLLPRLNLQGIGFFAEKHGLPDATVERASILTRDPSAWGTFVEKLLASEGSQARNGLLVEGWRALPRWAGAVPAARQKLLAKLAEGGGIEPHGPRLQRYQALLEGLLEAPASIDVEVSTAWVASLEDTPPGTLAFWDGMGALERLARARPSLAVGMVIPIWDMWNHRAKEAQNATWTGWEDRALTPLTLGDRVLAVLGAAAEVDPSYEAYFRNWASEVLTEIKDLPIGSKQAVGPDSSVAATRIIATLCGLHDPYAVRLQERAMEILARA